MLFLFFALLSCSSSPEKKDVSTDTKKIPLLYAKGFSIFKTESSYLLRTHSPVDPSDVYQEIEIGKENSVVSSSTQLHFPQSPGKCILLSTTYLSYFTALREISSIAGISNADLVFSENIIKLVNSGAISNIGNDQALNYEQIVNLKPTLVLTYDFGSTTSAHISKLEELGVPVLKVGEFKEISPLGKAEWIKFFGVLFGKFEQADSLFNEIENQYNQLVQENQKFEKRPSVFTGLPWEGQWHQPGGKSFQATYIRDAGGFYLWENDDHVSGINVDMEVVYDIALEADIWLHPGNALSLDEISRSDSRYRHFKSFSMGGVYNNNQRLNENKGNDYWESGVLEPHIILADLMAIFHPEKYPEYKLKYYRKLE